VLRPPAQAQRFGVAVSGRGSSAPRVSLGVPVDALRAQTPGRDVSVPADPLGLQQAAALRVAAGQADHPGSGQGQRLLVRQPLDRGLHPSAVRHVPPDGQAVGPGRLGVLRLLRLPLPLLLGPAAVSGLHADRDTDLVGAGECQDGRAGGGWPRCWRSTSTWSPSVRGCC